MILTNILLKVFYYFVTFLVKLLQTFTRVYKVRL